MVVIYFHPMRMTYLILPGPFSPENIKMVKARQITSSPESFCDTTPCSQPWLINFFKPILFMASESSGGFHMVFTFLYGHKKYNREGGRRRTNEQTRKGVLWRFWAAFRAFVDYRGRVFCAKLLQKTTRNANSFLTVFSHCLLLLTVRSLDSVVNCSIWVPLSTGPCLLWDLPPPPLPVSWEISSSSPLFGFRAKTDKEIICLAHHPHSVTFRAGRAYFLSTLFIAAGPLHHEESHLNYGSLSTLLDQRLPVEYKSDVFIPPFTGTLLCRL